MLGNADGICLKDWGEKALGALARRSLAGLKPGHYNCRKNPQVQTADLSYRFRVLRFWCCYEKGFQGFDHGGDRGALCLHYVAEAGFAEGGCGYRAYGYYRGFAG